MANRGSYASGPRLDLGRICMVVIESLRQVARLEVQIVPCPDIQQLQMEAQHRWLRPAEISEILWNYQKFQISSEPPNRPSSMIIANYLEALVVTQY
ncbi:hypothetical protein Pint_32937 [Pistacia integerrima]|uniref:Uncharacterized protein n=1 Tax=Pistacia integerrima TaxID=434235 RepID=A0ACC0X4V8_9ROSI|nr:hypothetical protein Pint_32937 [Pistacia integerrima]